MIPTTLLLLAHLWYAPECCAEHDCHPVLCSEIVSVDLGFQWRAVFFARADMRVSEDGACHVCAGAEAFIGRCIYLPPQT